MEPPHKLRRLYEENAKESSIRSIHNIICNQFADELKAREEELDTINHRINHVKWCLDRVRACAVAAYFSNVGLPPPEKWQKTIKTEVTEKLGGPPPSDDSDKKSLSRETSPKIFEDPETKVEQSSSTMNKCSYDDGTKSSTRIIIGNVSKYILPDQREENDLSTHKWMVYVRGLPNSPDLCSVVHKVRFFLHASYKPHDLVEISSPPFHLTRRGWGEFPVRVQLHFRDSQTKPVDVIHNLKLDKTYTGLQTLGSETYVDIDTSNVLDRRGDRSQMSETSIESASKILKDFEKQVEDMSMTLDDFRNDLISDQSDTENDILTSDENHTTVHNDLPEISRTENPKHPVCVKERVFHHENNISAVSGGQAEVSSSPLTVPSSKKSANDTIGWRSTSQKFVSLLNSKIHRTPVIGEKLLPLDTNKITAVSRTHSQPGSIFNTRKSQNVSVVMKSQNSKQNGLPQTKPASMQMNFVLMPTQGQQSLLSGQKFFLRPMSAIPSNVQSLLARSTGKVPMKLVISPNAGQLNSLIGGDVRTSPGFSGRHLRIGSALKSERPCSPVVVESYEEKIVAEMNTIPKLKKDKDLYELLKFLVKKYPLVSENAPKSDLPFSARSQLQFQSWALPKRRASQWCRAVAMKNTLKLFYNNDPSARIKDMPSTKQIAVWCYQHGFYIPEALSNEKDISADEKLWCKCGVELDEEQNICCQCDKNEGHSLNSLSVNSAMLKLAELKKSHEDQNTSSDTEDVDIISFTDPKQQRTVAPDNDPLRPPKKPVPKTYHPMTEMQRYVRGAALEIGVCLQHVASDDGQHYPLVEETLLAAVKLFSEDLVRKSTSEVFQERQATSSFSAQGREVSISPEHVYRCLLTMKQCDFITNTGLGKEPIHSSEMPL